MPSQTLRANLEAWAPLLPPTAAVVSLMKGVELGTTKRMSEVIAEVGRRGRPSDRRGLRAEPRPRDRRTPAGGMRRRVVDEPTAERVATSCVTPWFRPYTNDDVVGIELGGAVKNVIALAVGMAAGLGMGDNSKASLITRGLAETMRGSGRSAPTRRRSWGSPASATSSPRACPPVAQPTFGELLGRGMAVSEVRRTPARPPRA